MVSAEDRISRGCITELCFRRYYVFSLNGQRERLPDVNGVVDKPLQRTSMIKQMPASRNRRDRVTRCVECAAARVVPVIIKSVINLFDGYRRRALVDDTDTVCHIR